MTTRAAFLLLAAAAACALGATSCAGGTASTEAPAPGSPVPTDTAATVWRLVWSDEFDGPAGTPPDARSWTNETGDGCASGLCGWGNQEKQWYTGAAENLALDGNGRLAITARATNGAPSCGTAPCRYTSARIKTQGKVLASAGRVEARLRIPAGQGLWPAFWLLGESIATKPWPACGELDVMENHGSDPRSTSSAIHGPGYSGQTPFARSTMLASGAYSDDFHRFAVEWDGSSVRFYVDDALHYAVTRAEVEQKGPWVFDQPFFIILNVAVGGTFDGDPKSDAVLPATMLVDWVRVSTRQSR